MLSEEGAKIAADRAWVEDCTAHLAQAETALEKVFTALARK